MANDKLRQEHERVLGAYERRKAHSSNETAFFGYENMAHIVRVQQRHHATLQLLYEHGFHPLTGMKIIDVGCGDGNMLRQFLQWGAHPNDLVGVELRPGPVARGRELNPAITMCVGSAANLPVMNESFDLVCQHTLFTSILDSSLRREIAADMTRVLRPGGAVLWYDFRYNNPRNPDVKKVDATEIRQLFSGFEVFLKRITLAPPIARRLPHRLLHSVYPLLSSVRGLCTHYLGLFIKPS